MRALFEETGAACSRLLVPEDFYPLSSGPLIRHTVKRSGVSFPTSPLPRVTPYPGVANLRSRHHSIPAPIRLCLSRCCHARSSLFSPSFPSSLNTLQRWLQRREHTPESNTIELTASNCECECKSCTARRPWPSPDSWEHLDSDVRLVFHLSGMYCDRYADGQVLA